ncbi:MAG: SGNH/GDSL hydrolase family protein [Candidatus Saccharibacteria bacterium]|nr:SGNH/GDSL hydrolase family protein [Candidatus Saccharibacteria bacterium]
MRLILGVIGVIILACTAPPTEASTASEYDDLVEKVTTKTLIHHIDNYYGKSCGSPTEDYAERWLHQFKRQKENDRENHPAAVASLMKAINSPKGAYAVMYDQRNAHDNTSNPYFLRVIWTEDGRDNLTVKFRWNGGKREIYLDRKSGTHNGVHAAVVASPLLIQGRSPYCEPEFLWGYTHDYSSWLQATENTSTKLFTSTFDVEYPSGYEGARVPDRKEALSWKPTSSAYDDLMDHITTDKLVNYVRNYYGKSCGFAHVDYGDRWYELFQRPYNSTYPVHHMARESLARAISQGDYAITYIQQNTGDNKTKPYMLAVFWTEKKGEFYLEFMGEAPRRYLGTRRTKGTHGTLRAALIASPRLVSTRGGCAPELLGANYRWNYSTAWTPFFQMVEPAYTQFIDPMKIYKSTFRVKYPEGYRGKRVPGPTDIRYLALGDSFSSGEGDTERNGATGEKYYRYGTDVNEDKKKGRLKEKCHVSTRSYPYRLAQQMGLGSGPSAEWASVACSGATIYDMNGDNAEGYEGQDSPLGRLHGQENKKVLQGMALNEMIPGRVKQIEFVKKYQPKVITLTAGGNDVDFGGKITSCAHYIKSIGTCDWAKDEMETLGSQIRGQFDRLVGLYKELKSASPKSKIYAIGYPQFITDAEPAACGLNAGAIDLDERRMIVRATQYMNEVIEAAARKAGIKYVDISNALSGGRMCEKGQAYMTGIVGLGEQESYHPNSPGHNKIHAEIKKQLNHESMITYSGYPTAGDESVNAPSSIYFDKGVPSSVNTTMLANAKPSKGSQQKIALASNSLQPGSSVRIEIRSKPTELGSYTVSNEGALQQTITIPDNIPTGYHTLFVYGKSASGEDIKITQTLLVTGKSKEDLDDDGVKDINQPCGAFIQAANKDEDLDTIDDACDPEITEPVIYSARNGKAELGEDEDRIYLFRNTRASELTGITNDYVDKSKNKDNNDALVGYAASEETRGLAFEKLITMEEADVDNDIAKGTPIILAKDTNEKCYALKPEDYLSPVLKPGSKDYKPRGLTKLSHLPKGVSCEE